MKKFCTLTSLCFIFTIVPLCHADEISLNNGDRISGTIVKKDRDLVIIKTTYAGEISINWGDVATLNSDKNIHIILATGSSINGRALQRKAGEIEIKQEEVEAKVVSLSQITAINPPTIDAKLTKFSGRANTGLSVTDGNSNTQNLHIDVESVLRTKDNRYTIGVIHNKAEAEGVESEKNFTGYLKYDYFFTSKWYGFTNAIITKDPYKDLNMKTAIGFGAGYQWWETPEENLSFELGLNYVKEDYIMANDNTYPALRWALNYDRLVFKKATFFHKHEALLGLKQISDASILTQTGFRFSLIQNLSATLQINWDWNNSPASGTERSDADYLATIGYTW